ncbi:MAG: hypothetical protein ACP5C3_01195 [Methanomicrobiales archaeon]
MALNDNINKSLLLDSSEEKYGYLVCYNCGGYYKLRSGESPGDFAQCECGGDLQYFETIEEFYPDETNFNPSYEDIKNDDMFSVINNLTSKAEKRKEIFTELSKRVEVQEDLLNKIIQEKSSLLEEIDEKNLTKNISEQKLVLQDIINEEEADLEIKREILETFKEDQDKLLDVVYEKRYKSRTTPSTIYIGSMGIDQKVLILIIVLVIIVILILYVFF